MKVQLSPWDITKTSICISDTNQQHQRRRKRSDSDANNNNNNNNNNSKDNNNVTDLPITASFIELNKTKKHLSKTSLSSSSSKSKSSNILSTMILTSEHQINVIGKSLINDTNILCENSTLQYTSPPGNTTSFLYSNEDITHNDIPKISAIYDTYNENIYALQKKNTKLICYNTLSTSSITSISNLQQDIISTTTIKKSIYSLSLIHLLSSQVTTTNKSMNTNNNTNRIKNNTNHSHKNNYNNNNNNKSLLIGSCIDGTLFLVYCSTIINDNETRIEYINNNNSDVAVPKDSKYIGCSSYVNTKNNNSDYYEIIICQSYLLVDNKVLLIKRKIYLDNNNYEIISNDDNNNNIQQSIVSLTTFAMIPNGNHNKQHSNISITKANVLGFVDNNNGIVISYCTEICPMTSTPSKQQQNGYSTKHSLLNSDTMKNYYYINISLKTGELYNIPNKLSNNMNNISLLNSSILITETSCNNIILYDTIRGNQIYSESIYKSLNNNNDDNDDIDINKNKNNDIDSWKLITDNKQSRLAILYVKGNDVYVACTSIHIESVNDDDDDNDANIQPKSILLSSGRISLATSLASFYNRNNTLNNENIMNNNNDNNNRTVIKYYQNNVKTTNIMSQQHDAITHSMSLLNDVITSSNVNVTTSKARTNGCTTKKTLSLVDAFDKAIIIVSKNVKNTLTNNTGTSNGIHTKKHIKELKNEKSITSQNGQSSNNELQSVPQCFIDNVTQLIFKFLLSFSLDNDKNNILKMNIVNDARIVLKRLIHSGKLSLRYHFQELLDENIVENKNNTNDTLSSLSILLNILELQNEEKGLIAYSVVEILFDLLHLYIDVTERQMVSIIQFMISKASAFDIATYFANTKSFNNYQNYFNICNQYLELNKLSTKTNEQQIEQDLLNQKLILIGVSAMIEQITSISDCNESFLRAAIISQLQTKEISLLSKLFIKPLCPSIIYNTNSNDLKCKFQWQTALCNIQQSLLSETDYINELSDINNSTLSKVKAMENLWSLHEAKRVVQHSGRDNRQSMSMRIDTNDSSTESDEDNDNIQHDEHLTNGKIKEYQSPNQLSKKENAGNVRKNETNGFKSDSKHSQEPSTKKSKRNNKSSIPVEVDNDSDGDAYLVDEL